MRTSQGQGQEAARRRRAAAQRGRLGALIAALCAVAAIAGAGAPSALAEGEPSVAVEFSCTAVTFHYSGFPNAENNTVGEIIYVDGKIVKELKFHFNGPTGSNTVSVHVPPGHHSFDARASWNTNGVRGTKDTPDPHGITCNAEPGFEVEKDQRFAGTKGYTTEELHKAKVGQKIEYAIEVTNTGNVPLKMSSVSDPECEEITGGPSEIGIEQEAIFLCHHVVTGADSEAGEHCNIATVTGTPPEGPGTAHSSNKVCAEVLKKAKFTQEFSCKQVTFKFFGFANLPNNTVGESIFADGKRIFKGSFTFSGSHGENTVEINLSPGKHHNIDVRSAWNTNGVRGGEDHPIGSAECTGGGSGLSIEKLQKIGSGGFTKSEVSGKVGETVSYEIVATNTGESTLTLSNFKDEKCTNISGGASSLGPGKSTTWLCEHKLTEPGKYTNAASVEANEGVGKKESNAVTANAEAATGACEPSSSLAALIFGKNVLSYVPKGSWSSGTTGVSVVNVEGSAITPAKIETKSPVNSCASNSVTGVTVCTANNTDVYIIKEAKIEKELTSGGSGTISFTGGGCTNCGVAMDSAHNRALIGLSIEGKPGFQFLNLTTFEFEKPFVAASGSISENPLIDPTRELILSAGENGVYEIVNVTKASEPASFGNSIGGTLDASGADCSTGIALSTREFTSNLYLADLTQAKYTPGSPLGTWTAPSKTETLEESGLEAGTSGVAVAQGTHTGVVTGEFGGNKITAIALPEKSGSGTPALVDYVTCAVGGGFSQGLDPHTVTAYKSPNGGNAIALLGNSGGSLLAKVDLTKMLNPSIVKRTAGGHACEAGTLPEEVESFISVP